MTKQPPSRPRARRRDTNLTRERIIETALRLVFLNLAPDALELRVHHARRQREVVAVGQFVE